jgi:Spy/CpxP family protein refolding chaperone
MKPRAIALVSGLLLAAPALAQHAQPYAGQQSRPIKALSDDAVKQYLDGAGLGYAKAAELNHYPGPMHVLELADKLQLTADQRKRTAALMEQHKAEARKLGKKVVDAEQALDELFRSGRAEQQTLAAQVKAAAAAEGEYRLSHLETHRRMRALLTDEQVARYDRLRGYAADGGKASHSKGH